MLALAASSTISAQSFEVEGIFYNINEDMSTVTISTYDRFYPHSGTLVIPKYVAFDKTYTVSAIGFGAFAAWTDLTSVDIPNSVTTIGEGAFEGCAGLTSLSLPNSVTKIEGGAFHLCTNLSTLYLGNSVEKIGIGAFDGCKITSVTIPGSVKEIYGHTFGKIWLNSIVVKDDNTVYDSRDNCNAIIETSSNTLIEGCNNTVIPPTITSIGEYAFNGCPKLTSIEIPNSVTSIGDGAFKICVHLKEVSLGNSITSIGDQAFDGCDSLALVTSLNTTPPTLGNSVFHRVADDCVLYVPEGALAAYQGADGWKDFGTILEITPTGVEDVSSTAAKVSGENGVIRIEGADGAAVEVFNAAGVCIFSGMATEIPVPQRGIYVVKVAGRVTKIAL